MKRSEGHIWVYSELGKGSVFKIYFPRVQAGAQAADGRSSSISIPGPATKPSSSSRMTNRCARSRATCSCNPDTAFLRPATASRRCRLSSGIRRPIHLLLADVVMPGMSGAALAAELTHSHPEMNVLYMSGYTDETIVRNGVLEPGILLLEKPFTREALIGKVRDALGRPLSAAGGDGANSIAELLNPSAS